MARPKIHVVVRTRDWEVMMAPVRFELLEAMRGIAPCSVGELAEALDRPADTLYPHLRKLLRIGVVTETGQRAGRSRPEMVYDLVADDFRPSFGGASPSAVGAAVDRSMQCMTGIVASASRKAAAAGRFVYTNDTQNVVGKFESAWLTEEEFAHVRERLRAVKKYLDARKLRRNGALHLAAFFVVPVVRARGAKTRAGDRRSRGVNTTEPPSKKSRAPRARATGSRAAAQRSRNPHAPKSRTRAG
jgi:DNA-binding transcriptional ArsR family regulator